MHFFDNNGIELKAECSIGEEDGVYGLFLESWGGRVTETKTTISFLIISLNGWWILVYAKA